jgi:hypothetical protein
MAFLVFEYLMLVSLGAWLWCPSVTTMSKPCCPVKKTPIRYQRPTPPVPATYADVRLPEEYTTTTNSSCNTTTARMKIWLGLSLVLVARSFMAFLVFEYLMLVSLGT